MDQVTRNLVVNALADGISSFAAPAAHTMLSQFSLRALMVGTAASIASEQTNILLRRPVWHLNQSKGDSLSKTAGKEAIKSAIVTAVVLAVRAVSGNRYSAKQVVGQVLVSAIVQPILSYLSRAANEAKEQSSPTTRERCLAEAIVPIQVLVFIANVSLRNRITTGYPMVGNALASVTLSLLTRTGLDWLTSAAVAPRSK